MSNLTTPTRLGRGLVIPGIDTKPSLDQAATALSYGGLHTPPQSAHESRRSSEQDSTMLEPPFSASPSYSNPTTPVRRNIPIGDHLGQAWQIPAVSHPDPASAVSCGPDHFSDFALEAPFTAAPSAIIDGTFSTPPQRPGTDTFELGMASELSPTEAWRPAHQILNGYDSQSACLGSSLFPPHGLDSMCTPQHDAYAHFASALGSAPEIYASSTLTAFHDYNNYNHVFQQQPQVVVPSQLSPDDAYIASNLNDYTHGHDHASVLTSSFGSATPDLDYELVEPPSPVEAYFAHSDSEDFLDVKPVRFLTPSKDIRLRSPISKRRAPKRGGAKPVTWYSHITYGCEVQYQGKGWGVDTNGKIQLAPGISQKTHECTFELEGGVRCGKRFERSEHLKRHAGSHSSERRFPCPLAYCGKAIQRPDNAGDHFKTHLKPSKPGKRNKHCEWPVLEAAIEATYSDKKQAKKLLDGLRRWIENGMPDTASSRKREMCRDN